MSIGLTDRQTECLGFLRSHHARTGRIPAYREIASGLGVASLSRVSELITGLEKRGAIRRLAGRARAIEIIEPNICAHCGKPARAQPGGG